MRVRPSRVRRLRIRKAIGKGALAAVVLAGGVGYVALQKSVTLVVDGRPESVRTMSASVGDLLDSQGIVLDGTDMVVPPPATPLADGMTVLVDSLGEWIGAAPTGRVGVWVMEGDGSPFAKLAASVRSDPSESVLSASEAVGTSRIVGARVVVKGKEHDVLTNADTVRELLSAMGVNPDGNDRVLPSPSTPLHPGMTVRFTDIAYRTRQVRVPIPYTTMTTYSNDLAPGLVKLLQSGQDGLLLETFRIRIVNGNVRSRTLESRHVLHGAIPAKRVVGARSQAAGTQTGQASWYYAAGSGLTAAHPWLPFGTVVTVTNLANGKTVQVVINDRGPFGGRIIDLSPEAFSRLAPLGAGVLDVRLTW